MSVETAFYDQSQGVDFDIYVQSHQNGFTYRAVIRLEGLELPVQNEKIYNSEDDARDAARHQAWGVIDQLKKGKR